MSFEVIEFRQVVPQEVGAMALVMARANAQRDGESLPTTTEDDQISDMQERMARPNAWAYVATGEEGVAGFALGYPRADEEAPAKAADTEYLSLLMVEPTSWGQGIGSKLLDIVARRARDANRRRITLWTRDNNNSHARAVYERKGFTVTGRSRDSEHGRQVEYQLVL